MAIWVHGLYSHTYVPLLIRTDFLFLYDLCGHVDKIIPKQRSDSF